MQSFAGSRARRLRHPRRPGGTQPDWMRDQMAHAGWVLSEHRLNRGSENGAFECNYELTGAYAGGKRFGNGIARGNLRRAAVMHETKRATIRKR